MGNRGGKRGGDSGSSTPVKKLSHFLFQRRRSSELLSAEEDLRALESVQRSSSVPANRRKFSNRFGPRGRRQCIQGGHLRPEQAYLIQLSWRCLTIVLPGQESPGATIFKKVMDRNPELRVVFGLEKEGGGGADVGERLLRHIAVFSRLMDLVIRNLNDLDEFAGPILIKIGAGHQNRVDQGFREEYVETFSLAMNEYIGETVARRSFGDVLVQAAETGAASHHTPTQVRDYLDSVSHSEGLPLTRKEVIMEDTEEAWRSLVGYLVRQMNYGFQTAVATSPLYPLPTGPPLISQL